MSEVTNLMISFSSMEDEISKTLEINTFFNKGRGFEIVSANFEVKNDSNNNAKVRWYGGSKCLEAPLLVGAFNHLEIEGLVTHLKMINWEEPKNVQIILKEQDDVKFRILEL